MRTLAATLIWIVDLVLKFALGVMLVVLLWLPIHFCLGVPFGRVWYGAGIVLGLCINGLFDGCDVFLLGWAKRISRDR